MLEVLKFSLPRWNSFFFLGNCSCSSSRKIGPIFRIEIQKTNKFFFFPARIHEESFSIWLKFFWLSTPLFNMDTMIHKIRYFFLFFGFFLRFYFSVKKMPTRLNQCNAFFVLSFVYSRGMTQASTNDEEERSMNLSEVKRPWCLSDVPALISSVTHGLANERCKFVAFSRVNSHAAGRSSRCIIFLSLRSTSSIKASLTIQSGIVFCFILFFITTETFNEEKLPVYWTTRHFFWLDFISRFSGQIFTRFFSPTSWQSYFHVLTLRITQLLIFQTGNRWISKNKEIFLKDRNFNGFLWTWQIPCNQEIDFEVKTSRKSEYSK